MSNTAPVDAVVMKPNNNIYTILAAVALAAQVAGLVIIFIRAKALFAPDGLF